MTSLPFDPESIRPDFPLLQQEVNGQQLVYLDNASTTQKPEAVIDAICNYYRCDNANVHRGSYALSDRATCRFEQARLRVQRFINAEHQEEVIWTRGTTEGINLVAQCYGGMSLKKDDVVLVSTMEHHANIVPWQMIAARQGAILKAIPVNDHGEIDLEAFATLLKENRVKIVSCAHVCNSLGTVNPIETIIAMAHAEGAVVMIDGAQGISHWQVDVQALDADFYAFSGHKMFGPTGIGTVYGKKELLDAMPPFLGGGEMIETVTFAHTTYNHLPFKFEAGTPNIAGAIGLSAAIDYLNQLDRTATAEHEASLLAYTLERARDCEGLIPVSKAKHMAGVFSFNIEGAHPSDVGMLLDQQAIAVRTGQHCAQPVMDQFCIPGTVRASFSIYNTHAEVDRLFAAIEKVKMFI